MNKLLFFILFILLGPILGCASIEKKTRGNRLDEIKTIRQEVERIIHETDPNVNLGIMIASLDGSEVIFEKNAHRNFVPASTNKLLTLAAALHYLGPFYRFDTQILTDGFLAPGVINNLYLRGSGDPSLMDFDLLNLAYEIWQMGIKRIKGDIYVDDQIFDDVLWSHGTMWDDRQHGFSAPISGLNLNYNRIMLKTVPSYRAGQKAHVIMRPATSYIDLLANVETVANGQSPFIGLSIGQGKHRESDWPKKMNDGLHHGDTIKINGQISKNSDPRYNLMAVSDPGMMAGIFLGDQLRHLDIKLPGNTLRKKTPENAMLLTNHRSRSLAEALIDFTKVSNNIANDALVKTIAAQMSPGPGTFSAGLELIDRFLVEEVGIDTSSLITADGSGISRYNLITPSQLVKLLTYVANHFHMGPEFMAALPIGGEDGTLSFRFGDDAVKGSVRAKTGGMSGISSLAGYLTDHEHRRYAFAIMVNGFVGSASKFQRMQDRILSLVLHPDQMQLANVK